MVTLPSNIAEAAIATKRPHLAAINGHAQRSLDHDEVADLLSFVDPDCGYDDWIKALMAVHAATNGSASGLSIADQWSARGSKYKGTRDVEPHWKSFTGSGIGVGTLAQMAKDAGADLSDIARRYGGFDGGDPAHGHELASQMRKAKDKPADLLEITASSFAGKPIPERRFHDAKGLIPHSGVTLIYGDGGTGKSLLALQLAAATVSGKQWLGCNVRRGPVFYYSAEDPIDEAHIRLDAINAFLGCDMADLGGLHIAPMVGRECVLGADMGKGIIKPMPLYSAVCDRVKAIKPALIIIDNAIDVFAGDQNSGPQVKQFMHLLSGMSQEANCPVVLLAHPSKSGMANGTGDGGSVHWSNSARARLYLSRILSDNGDGLPTEDDPCARILRVMKANYAATGDEIKMRWEDGCFVHEQAERIEPGDTLGAAAKAERVFLHLLRVFERQGRHVSASPSNTFAPVLFAKHDQREGVSKQRFERAMNSLFDQGKIKIETHGPASRERRHIAIVEGEQ